MVNEEMRKTTSVHPEYRQARSANEINHSDNLQKTKFSDAKQRSKYLSDGKHSSNTAQISM